MTEKYIAVHSYPIKLGQFLKLADIVQDGLEAKFLILNEEIMVNDQIETRRGRKLIQNDSVQIDERIFICA